MNQTSFIFCIFLSFILLTSSQKSWPQNQQISSQTATNSESTSKNFSSKTVVEFIFSKASRPEIATDQNLQKEVNSLIDFSYMSKEILGPELKKRNVQDTTWFEGILRDIISLTVYPSSASFIGNVKVEYKEVKEEEKTSIVKSLIKHKGEETEVEYKLRKEKDHWIVFDLSLDGESWTENIKDEVQKILKKEGWPGLKKRLLKRKETLSKKS